MVLQDSKFRGGMTHAGVLDEAKKVVGKDAGGHRKEFLELVDRARELSAAAPRRAAQAGLRSSVADDGRAAGHD